MPTAFQRLNEACQRHYGTALLYRESGGRETSINGIIDSAEMIEEGDKFLEIWFTDADLLVAGIVPAAGDVIIDDAASRVYSVVNVDTDAVKGVAVTVQSE